MAVKPLIRDVVDDANELVSTRYLPKDTERFRFLNGWARVHAASVCEDEYPCVIHRHSVHHGSELPMLLSETGLVEHLCDHGVGHPCPDSSAYYDRRYDDEPGTWAVHGCDGCCFGWVSP